jgi:ATP-dependent protease ClpP protease subunit
MLSRTSNSVLVRSTLTCLLAFQGAASLRAEDPALPSFVPNNTLSHMWRTLPGSGSLSPAEQATRDAAEKIATRFSGFSNLHAPEAALPPAEVMLSGEITEANAIDVVMQLSQINQITPKRKIILYIDSPGGLVNAGNMIRERILNISNPVDVTCTGDAKSMAAILFLTHPATKGTRNVQGDCRMMTHAAYLVYPDGKTQKLDDPTLSDTEKNGLKEIQKNFARLLREAIGQLSEQESLSYFTVGDREITVSEAQALGMIHRFEGTSYLLGRNTLPPVEIVQHEGSRIAESFLFIAPTPAARPGAGGLKPTLP